MPLFSLLCLFFAFIVDSNNVLQKSLIHDYVMYLGLAVTILVIVGSFFHKIPETFAYESFSCGALLLWFSYWKPLFVKDSPIFFFFPAYFALMSACATLLVIGKSHKIDSANLRLMQAMDASGVTDPWLVMCLVLGSLYFHNHFLQYPVMMTLLLTRYVLTGYLHNNSNQPKPGFHS